jgi:DNA-directed RNA polymerase specialized sigma24 family protein
LKRPETFGAWLKQIALRKCYKYSRNRRFRGELEWTSSIDPVSEDPRHHIIEQLHREQLVRAAVAGLDSRSQQIINALFFEDPVPSYAVVAERIGMASNSIGFQRDRCLERLEKILTSLGYVA